MPLKDTLWVSLHCVIVPLMAWVQGWGGGCLYNFRFWHLVALNIQTKKETVWLCLLSHSLHIHVYLNHIIRCLTHCIWSSMFIFVNVTFMLLNIHEAKILWRNILNHWKHEGFHHVIIKCCQTPESVVYYFCPISKLLKYYI